VRWAAFQGTTFNTINVDLPIALLLRSNLSSLVLSSNATDQ
jgi:hypothetical protein